MDTEESKQNKSGFAIASLVLGILATVLGVFGIGIILGILAIIFGAVSLKSSHNKALAGIITGAVGIIASLVTLLIFFVTLPHITQQAQTSQLDTQRKNDVSILSTDVTTYMSNNRGKLPDNEWVSGMAYKLDVISSTTAVGEPTTSSATYVTGKNCEGGSSSRSYSITVLLDDGTAYCQGS